MNSRHTAVKRVAELGKPGTPGHAVEYEVTYSRRQVFRFVVPFLVASIGLGGQKEDDKTHGTASESD